MTMNMTFFRHYKLWISLLAVVMIVSAGFVLRDRWLPEVQELIASESVAAEDQHADHDDHAGHDHGHAGHDPAKSLELSEKALRNVGFQPYVVELQAFTKTTSVPAMVVERPGRSQLDVTAPLTGIVTRVYRIEGEAITAGQPLFDLRLTHEDLVTAQRDFLRSAEELDVVGRELKRLKAISDGVIAGKRILEREYEMQKTKAALLAQREGLLLHGLSEEQVDNILATRSLLDGLTVVTPRGTGDYAQPDSEHLFNIQKLQVRPGQQVSAGDTLCVLADHHHLYIEGKAFEEDAEQLNRAARENWKVSAVLMSRGGRRDAEENLQILYLSDRVDPESRAFHFYIDLPNSVIRDQELNGHRFIGWKYKPGQRFEVRIPVRQFENRIVLPVDAVVEEGAETFVFQQNGDHFDRIEVHVEDRDQDYVVIANDGSLYPGDVVAAKGAFQMQLTLKNKAGGGIDPHAGHNH
ncbi:MAG: HlyD family efflux transporter periplasmic adaptor subunit [Planctomycetota bacterium]|nr:MAG: HlyD family efflux transporter periplasmic adaptor subunit [Planctomycetota bacterium]